MRQLIVRHGPAPGDTEDAEGNLHASFTGFFLLEISAEEEAAIFGEDPGALIRLAAEAWTQITIMGGGHMLIGEFSGFEFVVDRMPACGFTLNSSEGGCRFAPKNYTPLYAVARGGRPVGEAAENEEPDHVDLGIDYRGTQGPGDETIRPVIFVASGPTNLPQPEES